MLALTPISPFRPRRWRGALVPESTSSRFNVREAAKRPVSAVADQREIRDVKTVLVTTDRSRPLTLLFDPDQGLDERIAMEQFIACKLQRPLTPLDNYIVWRQGGRLTRFADVFLDSSALDKPTVHQRIMGSHPTRG